MTPRYRKWLAVGFLALLLAAWGSSAILAGPLSDTEVIKRIGGIPVPFANLNCVAGVATPSAALPRDTLVRISSEGGLIYYRFDSTTQPNLSLSTTLSTGILLPQAAIEYVQNGQAVYFSCITRTGGASASLATMQ